MSRRFNPGCGPGFFISLLLGFNFLAYGAPSRHPIKVILLVLDQLRADRLHGYGNPRQTSPNIDRLAEDGVRFSRFYTVAPWTSPSYASLMTALYPSRHGVTLFWQPGEALVDEKVPMLAQIFRSHGYHTAAFVNNGLAGKLLTGRGFDEYFQGQGSAGIHNITERLDFRFQTTAPALMERLLPWLDQHRAEPFFLFVLLLEPHSPYDPPPDHDLFKSDVYPQQTNTGYDLQKGHLFRLAMLGDQRAIERLYELYDGKIHFIDSYVGELMAQLEKLGIEKDTLVALTSDHGELLYSHPRDFLTFDHRSLYDPVLHIPLILAGAGLPPGRVVDALASNVDTAPTILDLAGLPPLPGAQGRSLVPLIQRKVTSLNRYVYAEEDVAIPLRSVRTRRHKLIENLWSNELQLFDLQRDPEERSNLADRDPALAKELFDRLQKWMEENHASMPERMARWELHAARQKELVIDDQTIGGRLLLTGDGWHSDEAGESGNYEGGCFWTGGGTGTRSGTWRSDDPLVGKYRIYVYFGQPPVGMLATNAPFTIVTASGSKTVRVNFQKGTGKWNLLGNFANPLYVTVSNAANGAILVDAVKFERVR